VPAEGEPRLDPVLGAGQAELGEPGDLALGERLEGHVGEGVAAPQGVRLAEQVVGCGRVDRQGGPAGTGQTLETDRVQLVGRDPQQVAGRPPGDHGRSRARPPARIQHPPQHRHVGPQRDRGPGGRLPRPELVDQPVDRDHPVGVDQQQHEQGALLGAGDQDGTVVASHFERPKDPVPHRPSPHGAPSPVDSTRFRTIRKPECLDGAIPAL
jgi:hypothetical protein